MSRRSFDYIVVGGGSAGCVVARRLAEYTDATVALLEGGRSDESLDVVLDLPRWPELLGGPLDYDYRIEPQPRGNSAMRHSRGRVLGGCSSHNSCIAFVPPDSDFTTWGAGWDAESLRPYYDRVFERVHRERGAIENAFSRDFIAACVDAGYPEADYGGAFGESVGWLYLNKRGTLRESSSGAYLHPIDALPPNLSVLPNTRVTRILFDGERAIGVETADGPIFVNEEVILSCGAFDTPKVLMLSGIGPASDLAAFGIDAVVDLPVGEHLLDHPEGVITWALKRPLPPETIQRYEVGVFAQVDEDAPWPDLMYHMGLEAFDMCTREWYPSPEYGFSLTPNVTRAKSEGWVKLRSTDPADPPRIDFRYFTDAEGYDERIMVEGIRRAREIARHAPLAEWIAEEACPGGDVTRYEDISEFVRTHGNTVYHPAGTCRMGEVVDGALRVKGVDNVRIADASIFPAHVSVNPNMTVYMIGERCAAAIAGL